MSAHLKQHHAQKPFVLTMLASVMVLLIGFMGLFSATEGGTSFTTESLRRSQIEKKSHLIAPLIVIDQLGKRSQLDDLFKSDQKVWIVDFIYTRCQTLCLALGSQYQQLQAQIQQRGLENKIGLVSISFDTENDQPDALQRYAKRLQVDQKIWQIITLANSADRQNLLDEFGVMVIKSKLGEFEHNAAFHVIDSRARLVKIVDHSQFDQILDVALASLKKPTSLSQ